MKKFILGVPALALIAALGASYYLSNHLAALVESSVASATGLRIRVGGIDIGWTQASVTVRDLRVMNPAGFPDEPLAVMPEIYVKVRPGTMLSERIEFPEVRLSVADVGILKNARGQINAVVLSDRLAAAQPAEGETPSGAAPEKKFRIERLTLTLGTIRYRDLASKGEGLSIRVDINERVFENVDDLKTLAKAVTAEILKEAMEITGLKSLIAGSLYAIAGPGALLLETEAGERAMEKAGATVKKAGEKVKGFLDRLKQKK